jgi:hypothetical protein
MEREGTLGCVTEIQTLPNRNFGSGYLLTDDLVITAAHVVAPIGQALPAGLVAEVRTLADWDAYRPPLKADLVWPPQDRWIDLASIDIALLRIRPGQQPTLAKPVNVLFDWEGLPEISELGMTAVGFPKFKYDDKSNQSGTHRVRCDLSQADHYKNPCVTFQPKGTRLDDSRGWQGMSGAALFADDTWNLVAILSAVEFDLNNEAILRATRLKSALAHADFKSLIAPAHRGLASPVRPASGTAARVSLLSHVYLLDRARQVAAWSEPLDIVLRPGTAVGRMCCGLVTGARCHDPREFARRLWLDVVPELRRQSDVQAIFRTLPWPPDATDPQAELNAFKSQLWQQIRHDDDAMAPPDDMAGFCRRLNDRNDPLYLQSEIGAKRLDRENAVLLDLWLSFWAQLSQAGLTHPAVHLVLLPDTTSSAAKAWLDGMQPPAKALRVAPGDLTACNGTDLDAWLDHRRMSHLPALGRQRDALIFAIENEFKEPDEFTVRDLKSILLRLTARGAEFEELGDG